MKRNIQAFIRRLNENGDGTISGGFGGIRGGQRPDELFSTNNFNCNNLGTCSGTNSGGCTNGFSCSGSNTPSDSCVNLSCAF